MRNPPLVWLLIAILLLSAQVSPLSAAPERQNACRFFSETVEGDEGYIVCDDEEASFLSAWERWGLLKIGYPISQRYVRDGFVTQAFQKAIMQWRPETNSVVLVNVLDDLHEQGLDRMLLATRQVPLPLPASFDGRAPFAEVVRKRQALLDVRPALRAAYFSVDDPLTFFGLPTSRVRDMGNHYAIRLQRAVLQEWKEDVPWAKAGEVTIANGGAIAREVDALPAVALVAEAAPVVDRYAGWRIEDLREERFGVQGTIERVDVLAETAGFTRYRISFQSDGLQVGGFMNVPVGTGPFPVVIVNHGYMPRETYETLTYTTKYADVLANAGFLVIHPNFRNHRGSEQGENPFRIGYARDLLHLIPMAQRLPEADGGKVGVWGHSMGGGVVLRALTASEQIGAAVLYGSMSGDEAKNYEAIMRWSDGEAARDGGLPETPENVALYASISPINYLQYISAPIAIHHGVRDSQVPFEWSEELARRLDSAGVAYDFYAYPEQDHNFSGPGYDLLNARVIDFFREHLQGPEAGAGEAPAMEQEAFVTRAPLRIIPLRNKLE